MMYVYDIHNTDMDVVFLDDSLTLKFNLPDNG